MAKKNNEDSPTEENPLKEKFLRFQFLQEHIEKISEHMETLTEQNTELEISIEAVKELEKTPPDKEILAPIANGIFLKGTLKDNTALIVNVGSDVVVERTPGEVALLLEQQQRELAEKLVEADAALKQFSREAMKIYKEVEEQANKQ